MTGSTNASTTLDGEELVHLAIKASEGGNHEAAISYLKRALDLAPNNVNAHYLLGAEHAELGMFERAIADMQQAVELGITLPTAHFQLGLLHISSGHPSEAIEAWKSLDKLGPENPLYLFKTGLIHLANDEFPECIAALEKGIEANTEHDALNHDMRNILHQAQMHINAPTKPAAEPAPAAQPSTHHVLLSAYQNDRNGDGDNQ